MNTLGCACATVVVGVFLLPALGMKWTLIALAAGYLLLLPQVRGMVWAVAAVILSSGFAVTTDLKTLNQSAGMEVVAYREGAMASVAVMRTPDGRSGISARSRASRR